MIHEQGDKRIKVTRGDVAAAVSAVGVKAGDVAIFHSSLSSMGTVIGGADTVIDGFLDAVGSEGTVAVPTLCQKNLETIFERWDIDQTPSDVGRITEVFRHRPDSIRSDNPTHSVAAIGAKAEELTRDHATAHGRRSPWGDAAFAPDSPWDKLCRWNASYMFIGVNFRVCTMKHYIESNLVEQALAAADPQQKEELRSHLLNWLKPGVWPSHDSEIMEAIYRERGLVSYGKIGSATLRHIRAHEMVDEALSIFKGEPERWFKPDFVEWYREATGGQKG